MILISNKINLHAYLNQPVPERMHDILADRTCVNRAILHYTTKKQSFSVQQLQKNYKNSRIKFIVYSWTDPVYVGLACFWHYRTLYVLTHDYATDLPYLSLTKLSARLVPAHHRMHTWKYTCTRTKSKPMQKMLRSIAVVHSTRDPQCV